MTFNIAQFRAYAYQAQGFQRLNRFKVVFPIPAGLNGNQVSVSGQNVVDTVRYMEFWTNTVDVPGISLITRPVNRYGFGGIEKKPVATAFQDVMMTFYNDGNNNNLQFFHDWMRLINDNDLSQGINAPGAVTSPWEVAYKGEYTVDPEITLYDIAGDPIYTIHLREAYPTDIPHTKMMWEPQPNIMQIVVMFTYFDWYHLTQPDEDTPQLQVSPPTQPLGNPILGPIMGS